MLTLELAMFGPIEIIDIKGDGSPISNMKMSSTAGTGEGELTDPELYNLNPSYLR
jgi:hypothetical protein